MHTQTEDGRTGADPVGRAVGRRRLRWRQGSSRSLARSTAAMPFLLRLKSLKGEMGKKGGKATRLALPLSNMNREERGEERGRVITCPQLRPARGNTALTSHTQQGLLINRRVCRPQRNALLALRMNAKRVTRVLSEWRERECINA